MKVIIAILTLTIGALACNSGKEDKPGAEANYNSDPQNYQEKVMSVAEIERSQPTRFLTASATYNKNIWGRKLKIRGVIKNSATVATYKNAVVKVTYYSETKKVLSISNHTINDSFPPNSERNFDLKIDNIKNVNSLGYNVVQAVAK